MNSSFYKEELSKGIEISILHLAELSKVVVICRSVLAVSCLLILRCVASCFQFAHDFPIGSHSC